LPTSFFWPDDRESRQRLNQTGLSQEVYEEIEAAAASSGCELLEAALHGTQLQLILDQEGGVTLTACEQVSRKVSAVLDSLDFGSQRYVLEVGSPGLDRKLYGPDDYQRFSGRMARVTWSDNEHGKRTDIGRLEAFEADQQELVLAAEQGEPLHIPLGAVQEARLEIEL
jgi:ribosome maturation factor RimP